ncbi:protoporphyrinogen/coproporphyrinogen oxidase [Promicromonospora sukumoe]|uniref:protoporphyrinogen/coproporphyrinogen oxidase n=1 Tax=Promicromonospora sukumoe TaxID=88382 RepID=UPI0037C6692C
MTPSAGRSGATDVDAVVVGAGIGGLVAAHALAGRGLRVVVLEAADRAGGPIRGGAFTSLPDVPLDLGAESFAVRGGAVERLAGELGLTVEAPATLSAWGYAAGRAFPLPAAGVLGIPSRPWAADVRRAIGWPGVLRGALDRALPARLVDTTDLGTLARSRLGARVAERLVTPVAAGVHSAPLDRLDVAAVAPGLLDAYARTGSLSRAVASLRAAAPPGSAVRGIDGGVHALVDALVGRLDVRFGVRVTGVERAEVGAGAGPAWLVGTADGRLLRTSRVVLTTPAAAAEIGRTHRDRSVDGPISTQPTELVSAVGQGKVLVPPAPPERGADIRLVTLLLDAPELDAAPRGSGMLVAPGTAPGAVRAKALTHSTAKWPWLARRVRDAAGPGVHVVRLSYGRMGEPTPEPTAQEAARDASALLGVDLTDRVREVLHQRWDGALPPPTPAYRAAVREFEGSVLAEPGLDVTGSWIAGTGLAAIVAHAGRTPERLGESA